MRLSTLNSVFMLCALGGVAEAQGDFVFQIDSGATSFVWSGTTSFGNITEQPPNFTLIGDLVMTMDGGGSPVGSGAFVTGGDALISPNIHGIIPNPLPFLPPLATIDLANAHMSVSSPTFAVNGAGAFSTMVSVHMISGILTISDLSGNVTMTDLAGTVSPPNAGGGTITWNGAQYVLTSPVNSVFAFSDPSSGASGSVTLNGTIVARHVPVAPSVYCNSLPNSTSLMASMSSTGTTSLFAGNLALNVDLLPTNTFGIYFYGPLQSTIPFGDGVRCVDGSLIRFPAVSTGALGSVSQPINTSTLPATGPVAVGDNVNFQFWYRDLAAAAAGFNTSSAMTVRFTP